MTQRDVLADMTKEGRRVTLELLGKIKDYEMDINQNNVDIKSRMTKIKELIASGVEPETLKAEIFALVRKVSMDKIGLRHYDVQMITSNVLVNGLFAEMKTGEGKTLAITPAAVYKALTGDGVHIFTSNDYLAKTNYEQLKPLYEALGLTVGLITANMTKEEKRKAYNCDIVYGSQEIIFDMLRDNTTLDPNDLVYRRAGFAIVDEADDLFIDSAQTPYVVSGSLETLGDTEEERKKILKELNKRYNKANQFVLTEIYKESLTSGMAVKVFETKDDFRESNQEHAYNYGPDVYAIAINETKEVILTEAGWLKAYQFYFRNDLNKLANEHMMQIMGNKDFRIGVDYTIIDEEHITLTSSGLKKAIDIFPKFKQHNDDFYMNLDLIGEQHYIENALKAYFSIHDGIDYELVDDNGQKRVSLVINGRTSKSRSYSEGLQQAIELKEISLQKLKTRSPKYKIKTTTENNEIASTSTIAFFQTMYDDYAGLTGTAPKESFMNLYGKETVEVEKNVVFENLEHSPRKDEPTTVYKSEEAKIRAIIMDVRTRHANNQPILIGTTSVEESEYIADLLRREGLKCAVLNARVSDLEEEAKIVEQAGKPGAITVATNMAGRGTDIKLGGTFEAVKKELLEVAKIQQFKKWRDENKPEEQLDAMFAQRYLNNPEWVLDIDRRAEKLLEARRQKAIAAGGLYVLGASHNKVKRIDDQLRGRAGRQSDPGESKFYTTLDELVSIGVHPDYIKKIRESIGRDKCVESDFVEDVIRKAQSNNEFNLSQAIYMNQEFDNAIAKFQESIYSQRRRALEGKEDLTISIHYMIDKTVEDTIGYNIPKTKNVTGKTKIRHSKLNFEKLTKDIASNFGITLDKEDIVENFETLKDLATYLSTTVKHNYQKSCEGKTKEEIQRQNQQFILSTIDQTWISFREEAKIAKEQQTLDRFSYNEDHDRVHELKERYNNNIRQARMTVIQQTFGLERTTIETLETSKQKALTEDPSQIDNSYQIEENNKKARNVNMFAKAIEVLSRPFKTNKTDVRIRPFEPDSYAPGESKPRLRTV